MLIVNNLTYKQSIMENLKKKKKINISTFLFYLQVLIAKIKQRAPKIPSHLENGNSIFNCHLWKNFMLVCQKKGRMNVSPSYFGEYNPITRQKEYDWSSHIHISEQMEIQPQWQKSSTHLNYATTLHWAPNMIPLFEKRGGQYMQPKKYLILKNKPRFVY